MNDEQAQPAPDSREGWAQRWGMELKAAQEELSSWHSAAETCVDQYLDDKPREGQRLNVFPATVNTQEAALYGNTPSVDVKRRNNDADDDDGRVAAEILERHLNGDLERDEESFPRALGFALKD